MAAYTSSQTGNWNDSATWGGGGTPGDGDTATIDNGHSVTVTASVTVGDGTNAGITIAGASAEAYGTLKVSDGYTLTVKGADISSNPAILINQYGHFEPQAGATIEIYCTSDYQTVIVNKGHLISTGSSGNEITFRTASNGRSWNNSVTDELLESSERGGFDQTKIYCGVLDYNPISNAAGTGLGSYGDSSFTPNLGATTPVGILTDEKSAYNQIVDNGDYYVDHGNGLFYFWSDTEITGSHTIYISYKYLDFYGSGILSNQDTDHNSATFDYTNFEYMGEYNGNNMNGSGVLVYRYKRSASVDSDRQMWVKNCIFTYCRNPIVIRDTYGESGGNIELSYNTFTNGIWPGGIIGSAVTQLYTVSYLSFDHNSLNSAGGNMVRGLEFYSVHHLYVDYNTGRMTSPCVGPYGYEIYHRHNTFEGFGSVLDSMAISGNGTPSGNIYWQDNIFAAYYRGGRIGGFSVVERNIFSRCYHHALVGSTLENVYIRDSYIRNNLIYNCFHDTSDMGGGIAIAAHRNQWLDNCHWVNNTCDEGDRGLYLSDLENTVFILTRSYLTNNIISNSGSGIYWPADDANNEFRIIPYSLDFNVDYNNTGNTTNIVQCTFRFSGGNDYNTDNSRNLKGFYLFDCDSSYSLPYTTNTTLALTVSGTPGTDLAYDVVWGGGASVDFVKGQGTATGGTTTTLVHTGAGWTTNEFRCCYVKIHSGTGTGQIGMIRSNTADTLTVIPNNDNSEWATAPDNTSVYVIYESMQEVADASARTVKVGIYLPAGSFPPSSASDTNIHIYGNEQTGDPKYTSSTDFHIESGSSAIDNGQDMSSDFTDDLEGGTRSAPWDIGAYLSAASGDAGGKMGLGLELELT